MKMRVAMFTALLLGGCARIHDVDSLATVHAVLRKDAPVQIVSITPSGDNELATVTIKNTTDRYAVRGIERLGDLLEKWRKS